MFSTFFFQNMYKSNWIMKLQGFWEDPTHQVAPISHAPLRSPTEWPEGSIESAFWGGFILTWNSQEPNLYIYMDVWLKNHVLRQPTKISSAGTLWTTRKKIGIWWCPTISHVKTWNRPIERTSWKWMSQIPRNDQIVPWWSASCSICMESVYTCAIYIYT